MRLVRLAVASVNPTVGAVTQNVDRAIRIARAAADDGATIVALPEQVIGGYPPEDLIQWRGFVEAQEAGLRRFASATADTGALYAIGLAVTYAGHRFNVAAAVHRGQVLGLVPKEKLPTYNVFYEGRTFAHGGPGFFAEALHGVPLGDYFFELDFG